MRAHPRSTLLASAAALLVLAALLPGAADLPTDEEMALREAGIPLDGPSVLDFFRQRTLSEDDRRALVLLVAQLDSNKFPDRQEAGRRLIAIGPPALPALRAAAVGNGLEMTRRVERCIREIEWSTDANLSGLALRVVRQRKPAGACEVLLAYIPFADNPGVETAVAETLGELGVTDGKPHPALVAAARDPHPVCRQAAAAALARSTAAEHRAAILRLLEDPEPEVRLFTVRALVLARDKSAVPTLFPLLTDAPLPIARQADTLLCRIAGDRIPTVELTADDALGRARCRGVWASWWKLEEARVDLAKLHRDEELPVDLARLIERSTQVVRDALARGSPDPKVAERAFTQAVMIAAMAQSGPRGADTSRRLALRSGALALAEEIRSQRFAEAQRRARVLPYLHVDAEARPGKIALLNGPINLERVMCQFSSERSRGLGTEKKLTVLHSAHQQSKELPQAALNEDLELTGLLIAQVADLIQDHKPEHAKKKDWPMRVENLRTASKALVEATRRKNGKAAFQAITHVEETCYQCHDQFRD